MAKEGILPALDDMFGPGGRQLIAQMPFEGRYELRVTSLLELLNHYARELVVVEAELAQRLAGHPVMRRSRPSRVSGRSWRPSSSLRSATSPASRPLDTCA